MIYLVELKAINTPETLNVNEKSIPSANPRMCVRIWTKPLSSPWSLHKQEIEFIQNFSTIATLCSTFRCTADKAVTTQKSKKLFSLRYIWKMNSAKKSPVKKAVLVTRTKLQVRNTGCYHNRLSNLALNDSRLCGSCTWHYLTIVTITTFDVASLSNKKDLYRWKKQRFTLLVIFLVDDLSYKADCRIF